MAQWLECKTSARGVLGSNPAGGTFGNSVYPSLPVSFEGDTSKSRRSLLSVEQKNFLRLH